MFPLLHFSVSFPGIPLRAFPHSILLLRHSPSPEHAILLPCFNPIPLLFSFSFQIALSYLSHLLFRHFTSPGILFHSSLSAFSPKLSLLEFFSDFFNSFLSSSPWFSGLLFSLTLLVSSIHSSLVPFHPSFVDPYFFSPLPFSPHLFLLHPSLPLRLPFAKPILPPCFPSPLPFISPLCSFSVPFPSLKHTVLSPFFLSTVFSPTLPSPLSPISQYDLQNIHMTTKHQSLTHSLIHSHSLTS